MSSTLNLQSSIEGEIVWKVDEEDNLRAYLSTDLKNPVAWAPQPGSQEAFLSCPVHEVLYCGTRGPGKLQPLSAKVLTVLGWTTMGELKVGDKVSTPNGPAAPVTHIFEHASRDIYRVTFDDGSSTEAGDEHLWKFKCTGLSRKKQDHNWHINDTMSMQSYMERGYHVLIPTIAPAKLRLHPRTRFNIEPYLLGLWLGDGHVSFKGNRINSIGYTTIDEPLSEYVKARGFVGPDKIGKHYRLNKTGNEEFWKDITKLGLAQAKANSKFIPNKYKSAPVEERLAMLQGLMDTDGTCDPKGYCSFTSVSIQLAKDVQEIAWSLGAKSTLTGPHPSYCNGERKQDHYDVYIQPAGKFVPFRLRRKIDRIQPYMHKELTRRVVNIEYVGKKPARCIRLDSLDHLYITDDYIVTHNTDALLMDFAQTVGQGFGEDWRGIIFRRESTELKDLIAKANKWFRQIFPTATFNRASRTWHFEDGEELIFGFMNDEADYWKQHGSNFPWIGWEELTNWPNLDLYKRMMSTNRSTNKNIPIKIRSTCNPHGPNHNLVKARFNLPTPSGRMTTDIIKTKGLPDRVAIHGTIQENKILLHAQPDYIEVLRASCNSPAEEAAWIYGRWDITAGGMFDDIWDPKYHVFTGITPQMIPVRWRIDRSYDHGQSKPFSVGWWAQSNGEPLTLPSGQIVGQVRGDLIRIQEWYGWDGTPDKGLRMTAAEIAIGIRERQREMGIDTRVHPGVADGSIFDQWEPGKSVQGDMRKKGVRWLRADKGPGTRIQGWQQCRKLLKQAIPVEGHRELPGLFVSDQCTQFLRTFPGLTRNSGKKDPDDVDTDTEDHIADEVRYRCRAKQAKRSKMIQG